MNMKEACIVYVLKNGGVPGLMEIGRTSQRESGGLRESRSRRPPLNYSALGIQENEHLFWKDDERVFVTVCNGGRVIYEGRIMKLAEVTRELLGRKCNAAASPYWMYNGVSLFELYNERYPVEAKQQSI